LYLRGLLIKGGEGERREWRGDEGERRGEEMRGEGVRPLP